MIEEAYPAISVVMPVRNEEAFIERSLTAMLNQDYPGETEVIIVDGMSDDKTRQIVGSLSEADGRVRLVDNPKQITPTALNIGIQAARYALVARMDAHAIAPPDYLRRCVEVMMETGADCVGGRWEYVGETYTARAIGAAMASRFGTGTAAWRGRREPGETDTVPFGLWWRARMTELGGFDERLIRNQDYEFNHRLRMSGGRIFYSPLIVTAYYSRQHLGKLWRQYFQYGFWRARTLIMHPLSFRLRHMVAPLFAGGMMIGILLLPFSTIWRQLYTAGLLMYGGLVLVFSIRQAAQNGWRYLPALPLVFVILHLSWGSGFLAGLWRWLIRYREEGG